MENEEDPQKRTSEMTSSSSNEPDNNPDLALAMSLQQQDQWSDDDDDESLDEEEADFDYEQYSTSQDIDEVAELGFLEEEEGGESESEMEQDEIDPDEMSYEELMELGETIGAAEERGLSTDKISLCLFPTNYPTSVMFGCKDQCVVCQTEYEEGESIVGLSCKHVYHAECITQWLQVKKSCPVCNMEVSPPQSSATVEDVVKKKI